MNTLFLFLLILILAVHFLYVESVSCLMYDVQNKLAPARIQNVFTHVSDIHSYNTRSATIPTNFMSCLLILNSWRIHFPDLACGYGMLYLKILKSLPEETYLRKKIHETLINIFKQENLYLTPSSILEIIQTCKTVIL